MKSATCLLPNKRPVSSSNWSGWGTRCIPPSWRLTFPFPNEETFFRTAPWQQLFLTAWSTIPKYSRSPETHIAWKTTNWNASSVPRKKHRTILIDQPVKKDSPPLFFGRNRCWQLRSKFAFNSIFFKEYWLVATYLILILHPSLCRIYLVNIVRNFHKVDFHRSYSSYIFGLRLFFNLIEWDRFFSPKFRVNDCADRIFSCLLVDNQLSIAMKKSQNGLFLSSLSE